MLSIGFLFQALVRAQERFHSQIPGFTFYLGFSGKCYRTGNDEENKGDEALIENAHSFNWFGHTWEHQKAHENLNASHLASLMTTNKAFAETHNITIQWPYAVAPWHSGVYPVHDAWKKVWGIRVTSTEEYPHLRPASLRRGFIHRGIMVLPRQTCGIYTRHVYKKGGIMAKLDESICGGELFFTFLLNPFLIFMTHSTNYGSDRLALYTFENAFRFLDSWTNLQLHAINPIKFAELYFERYPEEKHPLWGNPCLDGRHMDIWAINKKCRFLPKALIIGPHRTGSTALHSFLSLHPGTQSINASTKTFDFEEVQFFGGKNYANGIDWYMSYFDFEYNETLPLPYLFEKSATYFDSEIAPKQVHALLPDAKIIVILISPARRAYSWYQHMRAKGDPTASMYNFEEVIAADESSGRDIYELRQHCISPGEYVHSLEKWMELFPPSEQLLIVDGEEVKTQPASVMSVVQQFLGLEVIDYSEILHFDDKTGFFCQAQPPKCLGKGKDRHYPPMSDQIRRELQQLYRPHNVALQYLLADLGYRTPLWLQEDLLVI